MTLSANRIKFLHYQDIFISTIYDINVICLCAFHHNEYCQDRRVGLSG